MVLIEGFRTGKSISRLISRTMLGLDKKIAFITLDL